MEFGDLIRPIEKQIQLLKSINRRLLCIQCGGDNDPAAGTSSDTTPIPVAEGFQTLTVTKTNGSGTVTITFPDASTYVLTTSGEVFTISGSPLGAYTITGAGGATYKYYAY
jgi:hypothetical protein